MVWSNEEFEYSGLESFPNMQALFTFHRMNNEENMIIAIERFPSLDAMVTYYKHLEFTGWFKYSQARSYLGRAVGGEISGIQA